MIIQSPSARSHNQRILVLSYKVIEAHSWNFDLVISLNFDFVISSNVQ